MSKAREQKVLRIGVVQGGRIVEERILRKMTKVSLGQSPRNTFAIPIAHLPASYTIFEVKGGQYALRFVRGMEGRVSYKKEVLSLKELVERKLVQPHGKHFLFPIADGNRGKIVLGDVTLLFQFVPPPPPISKLQLPAVVKESWWKRIDGAFALILLLSLLVQGGTVGGVEWWWQTVGQFEKKIRPRKQALQVLKSEVELRKEEEDEPKHEEELLETAEVVENGAEEVFDKEEDEPTVDDLNLDPPPEVKKPEPGGPAKPLDKKARYEKAVKRVRSETLLKFVGSRGGPGGGAVPDTLSGGVTAGKLSKAWDAKSPLRVAQPGEHGAYTGVPKAAKSGGEGQYRKGVTGKGSKYGKKEIKTGRVKTAAKGPEIKIRTGSPSKKGGIGSINKQSVAKVFKRRRSAVKRCYEKALRKNPKVQGKVVIQFTIGLAGRVTSVKVVSDTTGDSSIGQCIKRAVAMWRFDRPDKGAVTFSYPFILTPG